MARGQRKAIEDKIREKEELVSALKIRLKSEGFILMKLNSMRRIKRFISKWQVVYQK